MKRNRLELSKNLLQMKFMQRTKANVERELSEQESSKLVDQELLTLCRKESDRYMTTNSHLYCENLRFGRSSYKGMNAEVEKLMQTKQTAKAPQTASANTEDRSEVSVPSDEMAKVFKKIKTQHKHSPRT